MSLVNSFVLVLQQLSGVMTAPTWNNFQLLMTGWVFARRRTVTGMIEAAGQIGKRHHSVFHRVFAKARWSLDSLGLALFDLLRPFCDTKVSKFCFLSKFFELCTVGIEKSKGPKVSVSTRTSSFRRVAGKEVPRRPR